MNTHRLPAHLTLITAGFSGRPLPITGHRGARRAALRQSVAGVLDRGDLFDTVERVGSVAPGAPLSFLVVSVDGLPLLARDEVGLTLRLVSGRLRSLTRATDAVGRMGTASLGVLLQGTGATAAGAVAARISHHLTQVLGGIHPELSVRVTAATGTGANWSTLPVAAADSLPDCG